MEKIEEMFTKKTMLNKHHLIRKLFRLDVKQGNSLEDYILEFTNLFEDVLNMD